MLAGILSGTLATTLAGELAGLLAGTLSATLTGKLDATGDDGCTLAGGVEGSSEVAGMEARTDRLRESTAAKAVLRALGLALLGSALEAMPELGRGRLLAEVAGKAEEICDELRATMEENEVPLLTGELKGVELEVRVGVDD